MILSVCSVKINDVYLVVSVLYGDCVLPYGHQMAPLCRFVLVHQHVIDGCRRSRTIWISVADVELSDENVSGYKKMLRSTI